MALAAKINAENYYTFADYLAWDEKERAEIINGKVFLMASPSDVHQLICAELIRQLGNFLVGKNCRIYPAPFDVRLFEQNGDLPENVDTVVQPDISVVCGQSKIDRHGCMGPPDLIIEILSPSTRRFDRFVKLNLYQQAGVREYWLVDPEEKSVQVMTLKDLYLLPTAYYEQIDVAKVNVLEGCFIELEKVFPD